MARWSTGWNRSVTSNTANKSERVKGEERATIGAAVRGERGLGEGITADSGAY